MYKGLFLFFLTANAILANQQMYTIAVCATKNMQNALYCKNSILKEMKEDVFIVKENDRYFTNISIYTNKAEAQKKLQSSSKYVLSQKPYVKQISEEIAQNIAKKEFFIDKDIKEIKKELKENKVVTQDLKKPKPVEVPLVSTLPKDLELVKLFPYDEDINLSQNNKEEFLEISLKELDKLESKKEQKEKITHSLNNIQVKYFDKLIISVDSKTNIMQLYGEKQNKSKLLKSYIVSTGKNSIQKPMGEGTITKISFNPVWYPTQETKDSFAKKGIVLPDIVPSNHKYNYMGDAKLNLSHSVYKKTTYRIHGTINEETLGSNESAGCIRMKNEEVVELAKLVEEFASYKSLNNVRVVLK